MKKIISLILSLVMMLSFAGCGQKASAAWQEHYDLGLKYVSEVKYEEAILEFTKALEIDPKRAPVYIALADVYLRQGDYTSAQSALDKASSERAASDELTRTIEKMEQIYTPASTEQTGGFTLYPNGNAFDENAEGIDVYVVYTYNIFGDMIRAETYTRDGKLYNYAVYTYDLNRRTTRVERYNADGEIESYDTYGYYDGKVRVDVYSNDGALMGYYIDTLDARGNRIRHESYNPDGSMIQYWDDEYDENGNNTRHIVHWADGTLEMDVTYTYDSEGNITDAHWWTRE